MLMRSSLRSARRAGATSTACLLFPYRQALASTVVFSTTTAARTRRFAISTAPMSNAFTTCRSYCSSATPAAAAAAATAEDQNVGETLSPEELKIGLELAMQTSLRVNKMKKMHQTNHPEKERVALQAWRELQWLKDEYVDIADGKSVALLLNAWAYFSRFWEKGKDGPANPLPLMAAPAADDVAIVLDQEAESIEDNSGSATGSSSSPSCSGTASDGSDDGGVPQQQKSHQHARRRLERKPSPNSSSNPSQVHEKPRVNPLDEIIDE